MDPWTAMLFGIYQIVVKVGGKLLPGKEIKFVVIGNKSTGKTHCHAVIERGGKAVIIPRKPTLQPGKAVRNKQNYKEITSRKLFWLHRDMPHNAEYVMQQIMEMAPDIIFWILDTETWKDPYNIEILKSLYNTLTSSEYEEMTTKESKTLPINWNLHEATSWAQTSPRKRNRCKQIVMVLNKMDQWLEVDPAPNQYSQLKMFDDIWEHYKNHEEAGPLIEYLDTQYKFEYLPTSFHRGTCLEQGNLGGIPTKFRDWLIEAGKAIV